MRVAMIGTALAVVGMFMAAGQAPQPAVAHGGTGAPERTSPGSSAPTDSAGGGTATVSAASGPTSAGAPARPAGGALAAVRPVVLSHVNDPATTPGFPGDPEFLMTTATTVEQDGYYLQYVQQGEHTGTHWGAPCHFDADGACTDELEPADLYLPAVKIDVRAQVNANPDYEVSVADLVAFERRYGPIPAGAAVIAWTGWSNRWGTPRYANLDDSGAIHQPGFSLAAVTWLIDHGRLGQRGALGTDTFGPDPGLDDTYAASNALYQHHRISLENLTNLEALPPTGAYILVGGPINRNGSGSPGTIYGLLPPGR